MKPPEYRKYKGHEVDLININWTKNLDKAWQSKYRVSKWTTRVAYGKDQTEAFNNMKKVIDSLK